MKDKIVSNLTVGKLLELIKDLPEDTPVVSCCASPLDDPSSAYIEEDYPAYVRELDDYEQLTIVRIH